MSVIDVPMTLHGLGSSTKSRSCSARGMQGSRASATLGEVLRRSTRVRVDLSDRNGWRLECRLPRGIHQNEIGQGVVMLRDEAARRVGIGRCRLQRRVRMSVRRRTYSGTGRLRLRALRARP